MNNQDILNIALEQSAFDCSCSPSDFMQTENKVVLSKKSPKARAYLQLPFECGLVSYGNNIVAQVSERLFDEVSAYINKYAPEHCFETPNLYVLAEALKKYDLKICFMAEYFLPDINLLKPLTCDYQMKTLHPKDFENLYSDKWSNALCRERKQLDVIAIGAYENDNLIGLAGASADCEKMYQIGIDVAPQYRKKGVASALTSRLALEIIAMEKVPFYCAAWSNIKSVRNALKCGFRPAWAEITAKSSGFVDEINSKTIRT